MAGKLMLELIERLEKAEVGSRLLDAQLTVALDIRPDWLSKIGILWVDSKNQPFPVVRYAFDCKKGPGNPPTGPFPAYTTSLDAITALIGEKLPEHDWSIGHLPTSDDADHEEHHNFGCLLYDAPRSSPGDALGHGATVPLAACVALLRALQDKEASHGG